MCNIAILATACSELIWLFQSYDAYDVNLSTDCG